MKYRWLNPEPCLPFTIPAYPPVLYCKFANQLNHLGRQHGIFLKLLRWSKVQLGMRITALRLEQNYLPRFYVRAKHISVPLPACLLTLCPCPRGWIHGFSLQLSLLLWRKTSLFPSPLPHCRQIKLGVRVLWSHSTLCFYASIAHTVYETVCPTRHWSYTKAGIVSYSSLYSLCLGTEVRR